MPRLTIPAMAVLSVLVRLARGWLRFVRRLLRAAFAARGFGRLDGSEEDRRRVGQAIENGAGRAYRVRHRVRDRPVGADRPRLPDALAAEDRSRTRRLKVAHGDR